MSPVLLLILLLLSRSIHACNARTLTVDVTSKGFGMTRQLDEASGGTVHVDTIQGGESATNGKLIKSSEMQTKDAEWKRRPRVLSAGAVQNPSPVKVSWRVPRDGRGEHPRFDVDYVGPRTHPPSHN